MRTWNIRLLGFSILHVLGTLAIPALIFLLTSCIKKEDDKIDDGPEVSAQQVGLAFSNAASGKTLADSKKGDWSLIETTQRIFTGQPEIAGLTSKEMVNMVENGDLYDLQILKSVYDYAQTPPVVSNQSIENCQVLKDGSQHSCAYSPMIASTKLVGPDLSAYHFSRTNNNNEIQAMAGGTSSYHNLSVTQKTSEPPALVKNRANCGNVPGCLLHITTIEFDEIRIEDGERTRYHHEFDFSKDAPFLSIIQRHCVKWNYKAENRYLPALLCESAVNFIYGN